jgi:hypothetical protein
MRNAGRKVFEDATVQCAFCGRYLIRKMPHVCGKQFRKRHIEWIELKQLKQQSK